MHLYTFIEVAKHDFGDETFSTYVLFVKLYDHLVSGTCETSQDASHVFVANTKPLQRR